MEEVGSFLNKVLKATVFLSDIGNFARMNEIYAKYMTGEVLPSRSAFQVANLPKDAMVEIEAIALK